MPRINRRERRGDPAGFERVGRIGPSADFAQTEFLAGSDQGLTDGLAVVLCSSDLDDLEAVCSRVLVIRGGHIAAELTGERINRKTITEECYRSEKVRVS